MRVGVRRRACARLERRAEVCARKAASLGLLELSVTPRWTKKVRDSDFLTESAYKGCTFSTQKKWSHFAHADGLAAVKIDGDFVGESEVPTLPTKHSIRRAVELARRSALSTRSP